MRATPKLDRIHHVLERFSDRVFAFDEFGPLEVRRTTGSCWAEQDKPDRLPATFHPPTASLTSTADGPSATTVHGASTPPQDPAVVKTRQGPSPRDSYLRQGRRAMRATWSATRIRSLTRDGRSLVSGPGDQAGGRGQGM